LQIQVKSVPRDWLESRVILEDRVILEHRGILETRALEVIKVD